MPEISVPADMAASAIQNLIPRNDAKIAPDHAPVDGKGIATNRHSPRGPYFLSSIALDRFFESNHL